jgi:hypothetical protein
MQNPIPGNHGEGLQAQMKNPLKWSQKARLRIQQRKPIQKAVIDQFSWG